MVKKNKKGVLTSGSIEALKNSRKEVIKWNVLRDKPYPRERSEHTYSLDWKYEVSSTESKYNRQK